MPPSSKRARAARKATDLADPSDADTPESIATPSKPGKKRGRAADTAPNSAGRAPTRRKIKDTRRQDREDTEGTEGGDQSDANTEPATPTEEEVIQKLRVNEKAVNAVSDFANDLLEGHENVPGYGKIAGRDWTYIIKELEINLGRPEQLDKPEQDVDDTQLTEGGPSSKSKISIDLGPDRQISRMHATISYDGDRGQWIIYVGGRNGLRIDTIPLKRGAKATLRSGSVIDINGTQMAFITTSTGDSDGPVFAEAIIRQVYTSDDTDPDGDASRSNNHNHNHNHNHIQNHFPSNSARSGGLPGFSDDLPSSTRVHPHSHAGSKGAAFLPPGTPVRQSAPHQPQFSRPSPASTGYSRGVMIESTESIDYSADSAKDLKPPHSYAQLIGMAILSTPEQQMTLNNIYKWIMANYAFYRHNTGGWQNSIRHNLSLNKAFEKIARRTDEPGKGMKWMISPKERETFLSQGMKGCRRPNPLPSSITNASDPSSPGHFANAIGNSSVRKVEDVKSPPFAYPYSAAEMQMTPERAPRRPINSLEDNEPELVYYPPSAKSTLNHLTAAANAAGSPPPLYMSEENRPGLDTPFPVRSSQKLMPPSTLQRPSAFMEFSSPAPFWKFGSTPLKPLTDISPVKTPFANFRPLNTEHMTEGEEREGGRSASESKAPYEASSPPQPNSATELGDGSPLRTARPSFGASTKTEAGPSVAEKQTRPAPEPLPLVAAQQTTTVPPIGQAAPRSAGSGSFPPASHTSTAPQTSNIRPHAHAHAPNVSVSMPRFDDDAGDGGIDLMKGFQPIGSFHKMGAARFGMGAVGR